MKTTFVFLLACLCSISAFSQKDPIEKVWYNAEKTSKIEIYKAVDGNYYGKIVWLKEPNDAATGKPRVDKNNKEESQRNQPVMGLLILRKFKKSSAANEYEGGTVYDPNNGKTYCGTITLKDKELKLRGYICGWSWLGRSSTWTLAE
jgi:uncharacterized protein (DUF2147 family)